MADPLVVLSDTVNIISQGIVVIDYDQPQHHALCRHGLWEGWQEVYTQTIKLAFEHDADHPEYVVGWQVHGQTIVDPGFSSGTPPWGAPLPGFPTVTYVCPADGYFHEIAFTSSPGDPIEKFWVQVLYRSSYEQASPSVGPGTWVTLSGQTIEWPWFLLAEQGECIKRFLQLINSIRATVGGFAPVNPGDPVEWATQFTPEEARHLQAALHVLGRMDVDKQSELAKRIGSHANAIVQTRAADRRPSM